MEPDKQPPPAFFETYISPIIQPFFDIIGLPETYASDAGFQGFIFLIIPIFISIIFTLFKFFGSIYSYINEKFLNKPLMNGYWTGIAYDNNSKIRKIDEYFSRQKGVRLKVTGKRIYPPEQKGWQWTFYGTYKRGEVLGSFLSDRGDVNSRGVIILRSAKVADLFRGHYVTFADKAHKDGISSSNTIRNIVYEWRRGPYKSNISAIESENQYLIEGY